MVIGGRWIREWLSGPLANKLATKSFGRRVDTGSGNGVITLSGLGALDFWDESGFVDNIHWEDEKMALPVSIKGRW